MSKKELEKEEVIKMKNSWKELYIPEKDVLDYRI